MITRVCLRGLALTFLTILCFISEFSFAVNCNDLWASPMLAPSAIDYPSLYPKAFGFSLKAHNGQTYVFDIPFRDHLESVEAVLRRFGFDPKTEIGAKLFILARLHDVVEDVPAVNFEEVDFRFGTEIGRMVRALTSDQSLPRIEGFQKIFPLLRANPLALMVKLADRIANTEAGILMDIIHGDDSYVQNSLMEFPLFKQELFVAGSLAEPLWHELEGTLLQYSLEFAGRRSPLNHEE